MLRLSRISGTDSSLFIAICSLLFNLNACFNIFSSETTFETCGVFLQDFELYTTEQGDFIHEVLEHLRLNQIRSQSVIIKTKLSKREIHPSIFRSMKYDCYLNVHINFGKKLFSTIPSIKNPLKSAYQKGLFIILVRNNARDMLNADKESWEVQLARQYRIFVFRVQRSRRFNKHRVKLMFSLYKTYFFCAYCKRGLVRLNFTNTTNILFLKLLHFEKHWEPSLAKHYYQRSRSKDEKLCSKLNVMSLYTMKNKGCQTTDMRIRMIVFASGMNITIKPYIYKHYDKSKPSQIYGHAQYHSGFDRYKYSDPIFRRYASLSIIYCFNAGRVTVAETQMWTKYVPLDVWCLVGLCLILSSILFSSHDMSVKFLCQDFFLVVNSLFKLGRLVLRQSWSHKWKVLGILELLFSFLLSIYENSITVSVVVPLVQKPFLNTKELNNNNFTFVVQHDQFSKIYKWFSDEYNTVNHPRVLRIEKFQCLCKWLERYFLKPTPETKYAIVGELSKHFNFRAVTFVKQKNDTCYHMYPTEKPFYLDPVYFLFVSAVSSSFHKGTSLLCAVGIARAFENAKEFRTSLEALNYTRPLVAKYSKEVTHKDLKNRRLKESMITLGNLKLVLHLMLILFVSASVSFVLEVSIIKIVLLMLPSRTRLTEQ